MVKPVFFFLAPALFVALIIIFQRTSRRKLFLLVIGLGIIFIAPSYIYNLLRWQPLLQTIQNLPVSGVKYHRHGGLFPDSPPGMGINFFVPNETFEEVKQTIEARLAQNNIKLLNYRLEGDGPLIAKFSIIKITEERTEAKIYVSLAFQG